MTTLTTPPERSTAAPAALHLVRWTVTSGSNVQSRGAVVIASGDHQWEASAEGNGPVDALYRAVDRALGEVLTGHPRLLSYDVHAVAEGPDSEGIVRVKIAPPSSAAGRRATGRYRGEARSTNIIAASIEAYLDAINRLLAEAHWAGATEAAGNRKRARARVEPPKRAEYDASEAHHDTTAWFNR
ncbi:MAG TPA: alpha-isopropylmalate synthase regulatory domain-containing protein [Candidatus Limnocylindrales bacterium]|nr:alpha-isopropylmalate synthase regulatory domain-containing protein [Candidatus Limnocylindrales bacterium]